MQNTSPLRLAGCLRIAANGLGLGEVAEPKSNIIRGGKYLIERLHMKVLMRLVLNGCNRIILNSTNE